MKRIPGLLFFLCSAWFLFADEFSFSADSLSSTRAKGKERTDLVGNAKIVSESLVISADSIVLYGKNYRYAVCSGNVNAVDEKKGLRLATSKLFYDRDDKISRLEGFSTLEDKRNQLVIKGGYIENNEKTEIAVIRVGVTVLKKDMVCRSEYARYNRKEKIFELSGDPKVKWKDDDYVAEYITVNLDTEDIVMRGAVKGSVVKKEESKTEEQVSSDAKQAGESEDSSGASSDKTPAQ
jgi:lipopolysaccharide export system protein LptA